MLGDFTKIFVTRLRCVSHSITIAFEDSETSTTTNRKLGEVRESPCLKHTHTHAHTHAHTRAHTHMHKHTYTHTSNMEPCVNCQCTYLMLLRHSLFCFALDRFVCNWKQPLIQNSAHIRSDQWVVVKAIVQ